MEIQDIDNGLYKIISIKNSDGSIDNEQILCIAVSGQGKSTYVERIAQEFSRCGYTICAITEKPDKPLEIGFCQFMPKVKYHLDALKIQGLKMREQNCKIYHPTTFNIPIQRKLPPIKFFTIPIKSNKTMELTMLLETVSNSDEVKSLREALKMLKDDEGLFHLFYNLKKLIKSEKEVIGTKFVKKIGDRENFYMDEPISGSSKTISSIISDLNPFIDNYMFGTENSPFNLDFKEILRDNKNYHILTTAFIEEFKLKFYVSIWFLNRLIETMRNWDESRDGKLNPVLLIVQEGSVYLPEYTKEIWIKIASEIFRKRLITIRNVGKGCSSITDSQNLYELSTSYRESITWNFYGKISNDDLERISKVRGLSMENRRKFNTRKRGHVMCIEDPDLEDYSFLLPAYSHNETGENLFDSYAKTYPDKLVNYKEFLKELKIMANEEEMRSKEKLEKYFKAEKDKIVEVMKRKAMEEKGKDKLKELEIELKQSRNKEKESLYMEAYNLSLQGLSWVKVGERLNISDHSAKTYSERGKNLIKNKSSKDFKDEEDIKNE